MFQNKEVKVVAGAFNKVVLDVVELAKLGWEVEKGNSITLIGGSMKVLMYKENANKTVSDNDESDKSEESTEQNVESKDKEESTVRTTTRKRQTKQNTTKVKA
jgi:hypothetical protein